MLTAHKGDWLIEFGYDNANRLLQTRQNGQRVDYSYNIANRIKTTTYPNGKVVAETLDTRARMTQVSDGGVTPLAQYAYDLGNRLTARTYRNGVIAGYSYNPNNWVTQLTNRTASNVLLSGVSHTHDHEGNKLTTERLHELAKSEAFGYDALYRLVVTQTGALVAGAIPAPTSQTSYDLDALGNWNNVTDNGLTQTRTHNVVNEITNISGVPITHDPSGNLTDDGTLGYTYDEENRLAKVTRKADNQPLVEYRHDALGRRVSKTAYVDPTGVPLAAPQEVQFLYDGAGFLLLAELSPTGAFQKSYVWGADLSGSKDAAGGIGGLLSITNHATSQTYQPLYDSMGNVSQLTDATGAVVASYRYSAYGELLEASGIAADECKLRFSTKYLDAETGLYWYGYRYYSPKLGRWLTRDPLGEAGGINLYGAFGGNPGNSVDPWGLWDWLENQRKRAANFAQHLIEQGYSPWVYIPSTGYWVIADLVGVAKVAEGAQGVDVGTRQNLSAGQRAVKIGTGAAQSVLVYTALKKVFSALPSTPGPENLDAAQSNTANSCATNQAPALENVEANYWEYSKGISVEEAKSAANSEGFNFELGRVSRFENARNAVVIGKSDLQEGVINKIELAEEIQHGLDRASQEASKAIKRGLSNEEFHREVFDRILKGHGQGQFGFLEKSDLEGIQKLIKTLQKCSEQGK